MRVADAKESFNSGEFSPLVAARVRLEKYQNGLTTCENMIPLVQGGVTRRPGTRFVSEVKNSAKSTRLVKFQFSITQAYILEFGDLYIRVYKDRGNVLETAQNITGITAASPGVLTYSGADPANGDWFYLTGIGGMTELNGRTVVVSNVVAGSNTYELHDTWGVDIDTSGFTAYTSGGTMARIYTVTTTYAEADIFALKFTQSADVLYITHPGYQPRKLSRTGHAAWTLTAIDTLDGPYLNTNTTATTITPSGTTGSVTLTASASIFAATDVNRVVRLKHTTTWGWARISAYTSGTVVTATVINAFGGTGAVSAWRLGEWTAGSYPSCCTFFEDRLVFGTGQRIDGSVVGDYENFSPTDPDGTVADDHAISFTLNSSEVNYVRWIMGDERGLMAGSSSGEWIIRPSSLQEALTPTNVNAKRSTSIGSSDVQGLRVGKAGLFIDRTAKSLYELAYVYEVDGFKAPDLSVLATHILSGVTQIDYQQAPNSVVWLANTNDFAGFTYLRDQDVLGWHRHILGGVFGTAGDPVVESVAVIPNPTETADEPWVIVKRTINGATKRYIEYITEMFDGEDTDDAFFVDSGLTYDSTPVTSVSGLWHLEGQTVAVLADGATRPAATVTNGAVALTRSASTVHVGLPYTSLVKTLRLTAGAADGTAQGKTKRVHYVTARLYKTLGLDYGREDTALDSLPFRSSADAMGSPPALFTGDKSINWQPGYDTDGLMVFQQEQPLPFTLLGLFPQYATYDR